MVDAMSLRAAAQARRAERTLLEAAALVEPPQGPPGARVRDLYQRLCVEADLMRSVSLGLAYDYVTLWEKEATDAAISYWSRTGGGGDIIQATSAALAVIRHLEEPVGLAEARRCADVAWYICAYLKEQADRDVTMLSAGEHTAQEETITVPDTWAVRL